MADGGWRRRLEDAIEGKGKSLRGVSLAAGRHEGYLWDVINAGKQPGSEFLVRVCEEVPVSYAYIMYGYEIGPDEEQLLKNFARMKPHEKDLVLRIAESYGKGGDEE